MRQKQARRLRELAKLAAKFKPDDWKELLKLLPPQAPQAKDVTRAPAKRAKKKGQPLNQRPAAKVNATKIVTTRATRKDVSAAGKRAMETRLKSVPLRRLKFAYSQLFNEKEAPETRRLLVSKLQECLAQLTHAKRKEALNLLFQDNDASENYRQWLRIIAK